MDNLSDMRQLFKPTDLVRNQKWLSQYFGLASNLENLNIIYNKAIEEKNEFDKKRLDLYKMARCSSSELLEDMVMGEGNHHNRWQLIYEMLEKLHEYICRIKWLSELIFNIDPFLATGE